MVSGYTQQNQIEATPGNTWKRRNGFLRRNFIEETLFNKIR